jgi:hypothetical protein
MPLQRNPVIGPNALEIESPEENVHPELVDISVYEAAPLRSQVMDAISQLVSAIYHNRVAW